MKATCLVIDGKNLLVRNFFAFSESLGVDAGESRIRLGTNGLHGGLLEFFRHVAMFEPELTIVCWDHKSEYRRQVYPDYKNKRKPGMSEQSFKNFTEQYERFREGLRTLHVVQLEADGVEADDLVALSTMDPRRQHAVVVSTDKDFWQLVREDRVSIYNPREKTLLAAAGFAKSTGFDSPGHHLAFKVLKGDAGDGVPSAIKRMGDDKAKLFARHLILPSVRDAVVCTKIICPERPEIEANLARNIKLVSLPVAVAAQAKKLSKLSFVPPTPSWPEFIAFCKRYQLKQVVAAYDTVHRIIGGGR